jgi:hypothetical protein
MKKLIILLVLIGLVSCAKNPLNPKRMSIGTRATQLIKPVSSVDIYLSTEFEEPKNYDTMHFVLTTTNAGNTNYYTNSIAIDCQTLNTLKEYNTIMNVNNERAVKYEFGFMLNVLDQGYLISYTN